MAMARSAPKLQEIKPFMVEIGLCQVEASKRKHAHVNSKWGIDTWKQFSMTKLDME